MDREHKARIEGISEEISEETEVSVVIFVEIRMVGAEEVSAVVEEDFVVMDEEEVVEEDLGGKTKEEEIKTSIRIRIIRISTTVRIRTGRLNRTKDPRTMSCWGKLQVCWRDKKQQTRKGKSRTQPHFPQHKS